MKKFASFALFLALLTTILTGCGGTSSSISSDPAVPAPAGEDVAAAPADDVPEPSAGEQPEPAGEPAEASVVEEELPEEALPYPAELQLPLTETPKSLSFWYSGFPNFDFDVVFGQNPAIAKAEELTGVHADMNIVSMDSYSEKFNLMIATGEYPDLISTGDYVGGYAQAVNDEVIIDITDYVETCALNYMALISQDEITKKSAYSDDSRIYEVTISKDGQTVKKDNSGHDLTIYNNIWTGKLGSSGILVFVRTKHTGGSYEPLQTSYTIRARKANVFFGKGLQHETYCQRAWAQCIHHLSRAKTKHQQGRVPSSKGGSAVS